MGLRTRLERFLASTVFYSIDEFLAEIGRPPILKPVPAIGGGVNNWQMCGIYESGCCIFK